jgi:hypothetical protein
MGFRIDTGWLAYHSCSKQFVLITAATEGNSATELRGWMRVDFIMHIRQTMKNLSPQGCILYVCLNPPLPQGYMCCLILCDVAHSWKVICQCPPFSFSYLYYLLLAEVDSTFYP